VKIRLSKVLAESVPMNGHGADGHGNGHGPDELAGEHAPAALGSQADEGGDTDGGSGGHA
jgi:hypothetical protein